MRALLGGYTADTGGNASGIGMLVAGLADDASAGGALAFTGEVATADSPSWLAPHPGSLTVAPSGVVYAALEHRGQVQAFRRTGEAAFAPFGDPIDAGEAVCHVAVSPDGRFLVASCWGDGRVVRMTLDASGRPSAPVIAPAAVDPHGDEGAPVADRAGDIDLAAAARALREAAGEEYAHLVPEHDRAESSPADGNAGGADAASDLRPSRAHAAVFLPGGLIATTDLGYDLVRFWRDGATGLRAVGQVALPVGSGPRQMVWHPSGHLYVVTELSCELFVLAPASDGTWKLVGGTPLGPTLPGDAAAELATSRDGEFLYAGVRGSNTIATLRVRGAGELVSPVALVDAGVDWPRHHVVVRDVLLVAGQLSNEVASLTLDVRTGVPGRVRHRAEAPSPTCLLPVR
ncbi:MAG: 3-carboxymuconate cyclase [Microbacterium sp. SCN 70-200]|uniref:lactonase family protein n=1 Tax=unclassified Microbacterium TaxID=2609290 RepID=UPI00086B1F71|nr:MULTISPECIES: beta-propeller fold lactonase family protein [unclassified Microbacterium]MBN9215156.1 beta-propeller fold lactonase family protein [Microbacterium sp.]ODT42579.1 MAG: 3-carboxymuconate cyclase [Microbacterium sp. SCN 70-200]OJV80078.1 MAG: 3-carboxymuconate cyclase [Microbacterium sp. 70-16]